jgi:hypothetical protein
MPQCALTYRSVSGWKITLILDWRDADPNRTNIVQNHKLSTHLVRDGVAGANKALMAQCLSHKKPWHNSCSAGSPELPFFFVSPINSGELDGNRRRRNENSQRQ